MFWWANMNPAFYPFIELFDDSTLERGTSYLQIISSLHDFFHTQPFFGPEHQNLMDMLRSPVLAVPHSLPGQLEYIREKWGFLLGKHFYKLLSSLDLIKEEQIAEERKMAFWGLAPAQVQVYEFTGLEAVPERFSHDLDWMPRLVLLAKNIYVWLHELDLLAQWGFTGLWLIGLWEWRRGIRLANVDMVHRLMEARLAKTDDQIDPTLREEMGQKIIHLLGEAKRLSGGFENEMIIVKEIGQKLETILSLPTMIGYFPCPPLKEGGAVAEYLEKNLTDSPPTWGILWSWLLAHPLMKFIDQTNFEEKSFSWMDKCGLGKTIVNMQMGLGMDEAAAWRSVKLVKILTRYQPCFEKKSFDQKTAYRILETLLGDGEVQQFLQVNRYNGILWFNKESFEELLGWWFMLTIVEINAEPKPLTNEIMKSIVECYEIIQTLKASGKRSGYQVEKLLETVRDS